MATVLHIPEDLSNDASFLESLKDQLSRENYRYVRIPTTECCERSASNTVFLTKTKILLTNLAALVWLLCRILCITAFLIGRKFGPVLLISLVAYLYISSFLAATLIIADVMRALYDVCDNLLYHPEQPETSRTQVISPSSFNLPFEEVLLKTSDNLRLHSYFLKQEDCRNHPTILYLHGNAGNIGHRLPHVQGLFHSMRMNIFLLEYRGYGKSEGSPSEKGLYKDAQAALDYLTNHPDVNKRLIIVFGRSLGGAVAIHLASDRRNLNSVAALIVENTFTSIPALAKVIISFKFIRFVPRIFYKSVFASEDRIGKVSCACLFISGLADTLIPPAMMRQLFNKCGSNSKKLATFESGTHNQTWQCRGYKEVCKDFYDDVTKASEDGGCDRLIWPVQNQMIHTAADVV